MQQENPEFAGQIADKAVSSSQAAVYLLDPLNAPEPSQETGLGSHLGNTFDKKSPTATTTSLRSPSRVSASRNSLGSNNPFRDGASHADDESILDQVIPEEGARHHRRTSSLSARYPGDDSHKPLDIIRRDSQRAHRAPHLKKRHIPGADIIDRLDPAIGGRAYHHEGPYDAALLARNTSFESSPVAALETTNAEALKATPAENIKDAVERHMPLDGVAIVPPGVPDRFGRTYEYEEGADLLRENGGDGPGYKRWADKDYHPEDLKGRSEPTFSLDRALKTHRLTDSGIELQDHAQISRDYNRASRAGTLDARDPVEIAGGEAAYAALHSSGSPPRSPNSNSDAVRRTGSLRAAGESLKRRIGSLRRRKEHEA
ncbi:uncharacterized protein K489DRAFT_326629 [Dissoconium aciculare CBS 342.82]|uniref:Pal1-domain-containing protein n=1 Tax=Dissoconium aciculare CBS 342.82 TaxID=1314786 RepID=A0A6J3LT24_9PEZI|nr:uncharacterized protein K489DRAFT_326629 [Dissoconium aciculare CBS 342.82]KAF1818926.1 hypothetical protein K489DRAFT_326629 [Dissoconium aciculare CBS 342.82]